MNAMHKSVAGLGGAQRMLTNGGKNMNKEKVVKFADENENNS